MVQISSKYVNKKITLRSVSFIQPQLFAQERLLYEEYKIDIDLLTGE